MTGSPDVFQEGITVTLTCIGNFDALDYIFLRDGVRIDPNSDSRITRTIKGLSTAELTISQLTAADTGVYTCSVSSLFGAFSSSITVQFATATSPGS